MNAKYFGFYPSQQQRNLNPILLLTKAKNHAAKIKSESVQIYSKNGTDASIPKCSTARDVAELRDSSHGNFHSSLVIQNPKSQCLHFLED